MILYPVWYWAFSLLYFQLKDDKEINRNIAKLDREFREELSRINPAYRGRAALELETKRCELLFNELIILMSKKAILPEREIVDMGGVEYNNDISE